MKFISDILLSCHVILTINAKNFDNRGTLLYDDLSCKPIKTNPSDEFASSYDCEEAFGSPCFYKGKNYKVYEPVPWQKSLLGCSTSCRCRENGFLCAVFRCPEVGMVTLSSKDCYHIYSLNECCNVGEICPPFDNVPTCKVDGKTYMKGQKFVPKNTHLHCICDENFNGKYEEPYCRKIDCGIKLKYQKEIADRCAPYYEDSDQKNCPSSWLCPSENEDKIVSNQQTGGISCVFGNKTIQYQDYFEREPFGWFKKPNTAVRCTCAVPPLLTCHVVNINPK